MDGGTGSENIVKENHVWRYQGRGRDLKSVFDVAESFGLGKANLGMGKAGAEEEVGIVVKFELDGKRLGQKDRLVETAKIMATRMEGKGNKTKIKLSPIR